MDVLTILKQGMRLERDGLDFYLAASERSSDPVTAQLFRDLAADEVDHYNYIGRQYDAIAAGDTWVPIPQLEEVEAPDSGSPIFPQGLARLAVLPDDPTDRDALQFALAAEIKSYDLYSESARGVENSAARELFLGLAAAEQQHFDLIMARYEALFGYPG
jgi:rubrerythrin